MYWRRYLTTALVLFLFGILFLSSGGIANAASVSKSPTPTTSKNVIPRPPDEGYQYATVTSTDTLYYEMAQTTGSGPVNLTASGSFNVSSSWSANIGIDVSIVNAAVGFNTEQSVTKGGSCSYTPPNGVSGTVEIDAAYHVSYFNIYWHDSVTGSNAFQGQGSAQEFSFFQCYSWING